MQVPAPLIPKAAVVSAESGTDQCRGVTAMFDEDPVEVADVKDSLEELLSDLDGDAGNDESSSVPVRPRPRNPRSGAAAVDHTTEHLLSTDGLSA